MAEDPRSTRSSERLAPGRPGSADGLGLRERKKRELRQRLSDTATGMFLEHGFQGVRVSEIAAACQVSEKTVFNYFPTKESLLFDRGDAIADALEPTLSGRQAVLDALLTSITADLDRLDETVDAADAERAVDFIKRFNALIDQTPSLRAAAAELLDRLTHLAAASLARATNTSAESPENLIAAAALMGMWRVQQSSLKRHAARPGAAPRQVRAQVLDDLHRAAAEAGKLLSD